MASTSKRLISILLVLILVMGLAACTQATTQTPTTAATPVPTAVDKFAPEKGAVVRVASWDSDPKFFDMVIKEFNKRFPKIKVAMVRAPGGQLITP